MACPTILTGQSFLATTLAHVDCQAQNIGYYGWAVLSQPGSPAIVALTSLLTILVAVFGIKLMYAPAPGALGIAGDVLRVAIVLTLATSWPAWRVLGYDLVITGPNEIAAILIQGTGLPGGDGGLYVRLQGLDTGLAALSQLGSGRLGTAVGDWLQLGLARDAYLTGVITTHSFVRLMAGILLALAPLVAGLLLFGLTRSLFVGWIKALGAMFFASIALSLIAAIEVAVLEPWLGDVLLRRQAEQQVLDAPVEILVMTLSFALVGFSCIAIAARMSFHPTVFINAFAELRQHMGGNSSQGSNRLVSASGEGSDEAVRVRAVTNAVVTTVRRDERLANLELAGTAVQNAHRSNYNADPRLGGEPALGTSYRRSANKRTAQARRRDEMR